MNHIPDQAVDERSDKANWFRKIGAHVHSNCWHAFGYCAVVLMLLSFFCVSVELSPTVWAHSGHDERFLSSIFSGKFWYKRLHIDWRISAILIFKRLAIDVKMWSLMCSLAGQLSQLCAPDRGVLIGQKTCLLMAAAASLEICRNMDHTEQQVHHVFSFILISTQHHLFLKKSDVAEGDQQRAQCVTSAVFF